MKRKKGQAFFFFVVAWIVEYTHFTCIHFYTLKNRLGEKIVSCSQKKYIKKKRESVYNGMEISVYETNQDTTRQCLASLQKINQGF